jgi:hypothetical protein
MGLELEIFQPMRARGARGPTKGVIGVIGVSVKRHRRTRKLTPINRVVPQLSADKFVI